MEDKTNLIRWSIIIGAFFIMTAILWETYVFFQDFKKEERVKVEIWSKALTNFVSANIDDNISDLTLDVLSKNETTPMIEKKSSGNFIIYNIDEVKPTDSLVISKLIKKFNKENQPIEIKYGGEILSVIYYGNSTVINRLKYYPLALILIVFLFISIVYFFYRSSRTAAINKLWSSMAKETAHQIATPLSSIMGWVEIW